MKRLILLRHAKSSWHDGRLADHDRPLAPRGERDAPHMAQRLSRLTVPEVVLSSTAERARRTANLMMRALDLPPDRITLDASLYLASPAELLSVIGAIDEQRSCVLLVGHNPGLTELVHTLLPDFSVDELPTCALVAIDFDAQRWDQLRLAARRLAYYDFPKNPGAPLIN